MGVAGIKLRLFNDGLKVRAGLDKLADFFDEQNELRTSGARVDNGNFLIGLLFEHHIFCGACAVVAAGELARNSDGNDIALLLELLLPRMRRRTRRVARLCTGVHRVDHSVDIEVAVINKVSSPTLIVNGTEENTMFSCSLSKPNISQLESVMMFHFIFEFLLPF